MRAVLRGCSKRGWLSLPPGRYFRMHLVGYFEDIDSERGLEWRCSDSLAPGVPAARHDPAGPRPLLVEQDPLEVHEAVFAWVLRRLAEHGLIKGDRIGVGASTMEANAALRAIVRRDTGEGYRAMLERLAEESGIATPSAEDLILARPQAEGQAAGERGVVLADPTGRCAAPTKDGCTHLAAASRRGRILDLGDRRGQVHAADRGDTATLPETLEAAEANLAAVDAAPTPDDPSELIADKGYHSRDGLKDFFLEDGGLEEPHRREEGRGRSPLARRRGGAAGGLQQPRPAALRGGQGSVQAPGRAGRAQLRADPRSRRHAPRLAARAREPPEALPGARRRLQPRPDHAPAGRRRDPAGVPGPGRPRAC